MSSERDKARARRGAAATNARPRERKSVASAFIGRHPKPACKFQGCGKALDDLNRAWPDPWGNALDDEESLDYFNRYIAGDR